MKRKGGVTFTCQQIKQLRWSVTLKRIVVYVLILLPQLRAINEIEKKN